MANIDITDEMALQANAINNENNSFDYDNFAAPFSLSLSLPLPLLPFACELYNHFVSRFLPKWTNDVNKKDLFTHI